MITYEELRATIADLGRPEAGDRREVQWITGARVVGISRTHENRLEIFLAGSKLTGRLPVVNEALEFGPWWHHGASSPAFEANRLLFPGIGHFDQVAAFVCAELLRYGADTDLPSAFAEAEPVIGLVLARLWLSDSSLIGLVGELLVVNALCQSVTDQSVAAVVEGWDGWRPSLRDVRYGSVGVEVKTTRGSTSTHHIQGTHQVERSLDEFGGPQETSLILVSVGLRAADTTDNSFTLPALVERVSARLHDLSRPDIAEIFLGHVREYGAESGFGYDHRTMSRDVSFRTPFETTFVRAYDMADPNISVLRRADVTPYHQVDPGSLSYTIDLPVAVSGDLNPVVGLNQTATSILGLSSSSS